MNYWRSPDGSDERLLYINAGILTAIDAKTGETIATFGVDGRVDLRIGLDGDIDDDSRAANQQPGPDLRGPHHHVAAGRRRRLRVRHRPTFTPTTCARARCSGSSTPCRGPASSAPTRGPKAASATTAACTTGANPRSMSRPASIYVPTGTARYDFYGGNRQGENLFGNSLLALDARSGKRLWHFQTIHHDLWDYDLPTAPKLLTVVHDGVADSGDRATEQARLRLRLQSHHGRAALADRGAARAAIGRAGRDELADAAVPDRAAAVRAPVVHGSRHQPAHLGRGSGEGPRSSCARRATKGLYTPPSLQGTIMMPGHNGGANWGSSAVDPKNGRLYVVSKELPTTANLRVPQPPAPGAAPGPGGAPPGGPRRPAAIGRRRCRRRTRARISFRTPRRSTS